MKMSEIINRLDEYEPKGFISPETFKRIGFVDNSYPQDKWLCCVHKDLKRWDGVSVPVVVAAHEFLSGCVTVAPQMLEEEEHSVHLQFPPDYGQNGMSYCTFDFVKHVVFVHNFVTFGQEVVMV